MTAERADPDDGRTPLLRVDDLRISIAIPGRTVRAVNGVSFSLRRGESMAILGESGCGKSATARAIAGLDFGAHGEIDGSIALDGRELASMSYRERRRRFRGVGVSMVFQDSLASLNPVVKVGAQIAEAVRQGGLSRAAVRAKVLELMSDVGIPDPARRASCYPHEFSGGMRQRVMIAIALARDPAVLVADEPTTALDVTVQAQILELLDRHRQEREMALVLISHDLGVVARHAETTLVMYAGRVAEYGPTADVLRSPRHPYTVGLLESAAARRGPGGRLHAIPGSPPDLSTPITGCAFAPRCPLAVEECAVQPMLRAAGEGRRVACHRFEEVGHEAG